MSEGKLENIIGMTPKSTQEFLQDLTERIAHPDFCYAHEYQKGDMLITQATETGMRPALP